MSLRTYHDPLHGAIQLDPSCPGEAMAIDLIDTAPFQRLRRIRQLGTAYLTFQGAESSRFTHSLGVLHLARQALGQVGFVEVPVTLQSVTSDLAVCWADICSPIRPVTVRQP